MKELKLYKVIKDNQSCSGGDFDWTKHLPKSDDSPGKWTPRITEIGECHRGYHVTPDWNMWFHEGCEVYECETKGLLKKDPEPGVVDKFVCESVRLLKKVELDFDEKSNTGDSNTGHWNTGDSNTGNRNTGHWNTGDSNTGDSNTGDSNTGHSNTGNRNTGDSNTGHSNTGNRNTGHWNTGDSNTGSFNTKEPEYYELFNKPIPKDEYKSIRWPDWFYFELVDDDYKASWKRAFDEAGAADIADATQLPNFDYGVFEEITGITKEQFKERLA